MIRVNEENMESDFPVYAVDEIYELVLVPVYRNKLQLEKKKKYSVLDISNMLGNDFAVVTDEVEGVWGIVISRWKV